MYSKVTIVNSTIQACLILLFFDDIFFLIEGFWNPVLSKSIDNFSNSLCSLHVSVSHFLNSRNISNFLIIIIFVMLNCDQIFCYH